MNFNCEQLLFSHSYYFFISGKSVFSFGLISTNGGSNIVKFTLTRHYVKLSVEINELPRYVANFCLVASWRELSLTFSQFALIG